MKDADLVATPWERDPMSHRILVVEDEESIRDLIVVSVKAKCRGVSIDTVPTLEEGTTRLMKGAYDMLILDLKLPDGDGLDVLRSLRAGFGRSSCNIPIAVFTGTNPSTARRAMEVREGSAFFNKSQQGLVDLCQWVNATATRLSKGAQRSGSRPRSFI